MAKPPLGTIAAGSAGHKGCKLFLSILTITIRRTSRLDVVIIEGILVLHYPELREVYSYSVFVDTDEG